MVTTPATRQTISRFRSGKTSSGVWQLPVLLIVLTFLQSNWNTLIPAHKDGDIPRAYCRVEIEYSKFGVEDFDFECVPPLLNDISLMKYPQFVQRNEFQWLGDPHLELLHKLPHPGFALHHPASEFNEGPYLHRMSS